MTGSKTEGCILENLPLPRLPTKKQTDNNSRNFSSVLKGTHQMVASRFLIIPVDCNQSGVLYSFTAKRDKNVQSTYHTIGVYPSLMACETKTPMYSTFIPSSVSLSLTP